MTCSIVGSLNVQMIGGQFDARVGHDAKDGGVEKFELPALTIDANFCMCICMHMCMFIHVSSVDVGVGVGVGLSVSMTGS